MEKNENINYQYYLDLIKPFLAFYMDEWLKLRLETSNVFEL